MGITVKLSGTEESEEYRCGLLLKEALMKDIPESTMGSINIVTNVQLFGQSPRDVDIIVFGSVQGPAVPINTNTVSNKQQVKQRKVIIDTFFFCIETKAHIANNIEMVGTNLIVSYSGGKKHDATSQSEGQKYSILNYIKAAEPEVQVWISNFIWLTNLEEGDLKPLTGSRPNNILPRTFSFKDLFTKACVQSPPRQAQNSTCYFSSYNSQKIKKETINKKLFDLFSAKRQSPGSLTRRNIERIIGNEIVIEESLREAIGKKIIIIAGRAGTGKTVKMLKIGCDLARKEEKRCLFLTYNRALVNDIQRTLYYADIPMDFDQACLSVMTIHEFVKKVAIAFGIRDRKTYRLDAHISICRELSQYIELEVITQDDILDLMQNRQELACWDCIFVDEAQDFSREEKRLLFKFFGYQRLIIADGIDQFVRGVERLNWGKNIYVNRVKEKRCLRQEKNIANFVNSYAREIGLDWEVEVLQKLTGGKIFISKELIPFNTFSNVRKECYKHGNKAFEMLFLTPPNLVNKEEGYRKFALIDEFKDHGFNLWDGTSEDIRSSAPLRIDQHRLLQYDSCRGLEGWSVVCLGFDEFIKYKTNYFYNYGVKEQYKDSIIAMDSEEMCQLYVGLWSLIPLTRAIDSLVITFSDPQSELMNLFQDFANTDYVEFI